MLNPFKYGLYFCGVFGIVFAFLFLLSTGNQLFRQTKSDPNDTLNKASGFVQSLRDTLLPEAAHLLENSPAPSNVQSAQETLVRGILSGLTDNEGIVTAAQSLPKTFNQNEIQAIRAQAQALKSRFDKQTSPLGDFQQ